jgi:hypothetical protein
LTGSHVAPSSVERRTPAPTTPAKILSPWKAMVATLAMVSPVGNQPSPSFVER